MRPARSRSLFVVGLLSLDVLGLAGCVPKQHTGSPAEAAQNAQGAAGGPAKAAPLHIAFTGDVKRSAPIGAMKRGINFGNALDAPREGEWGVTLEEKHFEMAAAAGLDHVRLPVRWSAHAGATAPFTVDEQFFARVDWAIAQAQSRKLSIVVDFHHYEELMKEPAAHEERFLAIWRQIAERYRNQPQEVSFELLNEPNSELTPVLWNALVKRAVRAIRETNPTRLLVVDSYFWGAAAYLKNLELPADPNVVASFHMYQPVLFTHQGAPWMGPEYGTLGVIFPGPPASPVTPAPAAEDTSWVAQWLDSYNRLPAEQNPSSPHAVAREFDMATRFIESTGARVYMGEFGCIDKAEPQSRENYLRLVRMEAERRGMPWAYWDDGDKNRGMNIQDGTWVEAVQRALFQDQ